MAGKRRRDPYVAFPFFIEGFFSIVEFHRMISAQPRNGRAHEGFE
jgi:hypothetical protein